MSETTGYIVSIDELYGIYRDTRDEELIIDIRSQAAFKKSHIDGSISLPRIKIGKSSLDLSDKKRVYLVGDDGAEAHSAAGEFSKIHPKLLVHHVVTGNYKEWVDKDYPVIAEISLRNALKEVHIGQNDADYRSMVRATRLVPEDVRERVNEVLPDTVKVYYFTQKGHRCYLVCDLKAKKAFVINPLIEIHHHIVDQSVRMDCEITTAVFWVRLRFEGSPAPEVHAKDFEEITLCRSLSVKDASGAFPGLAVLDEETVSYKGLVFSSRKETGKASDSRGVLLAVN